MPLSTSFPSPGTGSSPIPPSTESDALMETVHCCNLVDPPRYLGAGSCDEEQKCAVRGECRSSVLARDIPPTIERDESYFVIPDEAAPEDLDDTCYGFADLSLNRTHSIKGENSNNLGRVRRTYRDPSITNSLIRRTHLSGSILSGSMKSAAFGDDESSAIRRSSKCARPKPKLAKTQTTFYEDAKNFTEGTIPQSIIIALFIGVVNGIAAWMYYSCLNSLLGVIWKDLPQKLVVETWQWPESCYVLWIPLVGFTMAILVGLSVVVLGEPGDLAYTIKCVHDKAYISIDHVLPMLFASLFSILGGGSLGPEAPLVAICAAIAGYSSRRVFKQTNRNIVRKHTLMGMAGALAAFFGCPLGGSLFALEVNSRFGIEYFEHLVESIFCGEVCLVVFRGLAGIPIESLWDISATKLPSTNPSDVLLGAAMGLLAAGVAACFSAFHWRVMDLFGYLNLLDNSRAVTRALVGATVIIIIAMLVPHTLFWSEDEFQTIATMSPASTLENIWPTAGLIGFEMNTGFDALIVGVTKMIAISFTVAGGYRGGFIFPFFGAGAAFGRALASVFPFIPPQLACLCFAAGINVSITRTVLATSIILCYHSEEQQAISSVLAASLVALFATSYMPFIKSQIVRQDLDSSLFYIKGREKPIRDSYADLTNAGEDA